MTSSFSNESNSKVKSDVNFPNATNNVSSVGSQALPISDEI